MALVLPFVRKKGARNPQALTEERLRDIARIASLLRVALNEAYSDLEVGMPYLGTALRLRDGAELPRFVIDASENLLRNANGYS